MTRCPLPFDMPDPLHAGGGAVRTLLRTGGVALLLLVPPGAASPLQAQTDFYSLDKERPLRVEDAFAGKRGAFEVQAVPFTLSQDRSGGLRFGPSVEVKHGIFPGVEASVGMAMESVRAGGTTTTRAGDVDLSALANLWVEGPRLPALGVRVTGHVPTQGDHSASLEVKGLLTRSLVGPVRGHLNGAVRLGEDSGEDWWAGGALDWVLPFQGTLLMMDTWVSTPAQGERRIHSTAGFRRQLSATLVLDAGLGRSWTGESGDDWSVTLGFTHEFGVRALMPGALR